jgi:hypothetical protein
MALRGTAANSDNTGTVGNVTVDVSGIGIQNGDIVILVASFSADAAGTYTLPSGFTQVGAHNLPGYNRTVWAWKLASSEPSSYTLNCGLSYAAPSMMIRAYSGRAASQFSTTPATTFSDSVITSSGNPNIVLNGITASAGDDLAAFVIFGNRSYINTVTPPGGWSDVSIFNPSSGTAADIVAFDKLASGAGATGTITSTESNGAGQLNTFTGVIFPITQSAWANAGVFTFTGQAAALTTTGTTGIYNLIAVPQYFYLSGAGAGSDFELPFLPGVISLFSSGATLSSTTTPIPTPSSRAYKTYLDLVNEVLVRLREPKVTTVNYSTYSSLVGKWVNDAKMQLEDAWDWQALDTTVSFNLVAGQKDYDLSIVDPTHVVTERARLRRDVNNPMLPMAFDVTAGNPMYLRVVPVDWIYRMRAILPSPIVQTVPVFFGLERINRTLIVRLYETPAVSTRTWNLMFTQPQEELVLDTDPIYVPWMPVVQIATDIAMNERGEEIGEPGTTLEERVHTHIANAISMDAVEQPHKGTFVLV